MSAGTDGGGPGGVVRSEFDTTDPDVAERCLRERYVENKLLLSGHREGFTFGHSAVGAPGFSIDTLQIGIDLVAEAESSPDDAFVVVAPASGRIAHLGSVYADTHIPAGEIALVPPSSRVRAVSDRLELLLVPLDHDAVAAYAAAMTGLDPADLFFHRTTPISAAMGRYWADTVAHVRDTVLADDWASGQPILLDRAHRMLIAALLATFPNTMLDSTTGRPAEPGDDVSAATLREVVDYLDHHAGDPVGPADVADLTGRPANSVAAGMRRRHDRHPAGVLWRSRLNEARADLRAADVAAVAVVGAVAAVAARRGFDRVGPFRIAYYRVFGEWPEDTLRR